MHWRNAPHRNQFTYKLFMLYLDLDELPTLFKRHWFWSVNGFNLAQFRRKDHLPGKASLKETVLDTVEKKQGFRPTGKVCLLTHLRYFGYVINPVSFYYCFDEDKPDPVAIVAEVTNVPWGEMHIYLLDARSQITNPSTPLSDNDVSGNNSPSGDLPNNHLRGSVLPSNDLRDKYVFENDKEFHVSPFLPMDMRYFWCVSSPKNKLSINIKAKRQEQHVFTAQLSLEQQAITGRTLAKVLCSFPFMTVKVVLGIYYEALKLWLRKAPFYPHNKKV